jgi:hypothetical protein
MLAAKRLLQQSKASPCSALEGLVHAFHLDSWPLQGHLPQELGKLNGNTKVSPSNGLYIRVYIYMYIYMYICVWVQLYIYIRVQYYLDLGPWRRIKTRAANPISKRF